VEIFAMIVILLMSSGISSTKYLNTCLTAIN